MVRSACGFSFPVGARALSFPPLTHISQLKNIIELGEVVAFGRVAEEDRQRAESARFQTVAEFGLHGGDAVGDDDVAAQSLQDGDAPSPSPRRQRRW